MATKPSDKTPNEGAPETDVAETRYTVLSGGISAPSGRPVATFWKGEIVTGAQLGGADRVSKLLAKKAIEVAGD